MVALRAIAYKRETTGETKNMEAYVEKVCVGVGGCMYVHTCILYPCVHVYEFVSSMLVCLFDSLTGV